MTERQRTVALLIDYDNLQICYSRDAPGTQLDLGAVISLAQTYGRVVVARAYAEWNLLSERLAVYKTGIEPAFAPVLRPEGSTRDGKSLADTVMVADGVDLLWTHQPDVLVLVTSDKDMVPLARLAKQRGTLVVVLGSDLTAVQLLEMANEFVTYRYLIKELARPEEKLQPSRVRAEPRVRRTREPSAAREAASVGDPPVRTRVARAPVRPVVARPAAGEAASTELAVVAPPTSLAGMDASELGPPQLDEAGQPIAPRRRRRRGGRGRRTGTVGDLGVGARALEIGAEASLEGQDSQSEASATEPVGDSLAPVDADSPGRGSAGEGDSELRPWERWPEMPTEAAHSASPPQASSGAMVEQEREDGKASAEQLDLAPSNPGSNGPGSLSDSADEASTEGGPLSGDAVGASVAAEWTPVQADSSVAEPGTADQSRPTPVRRRRVRRPVKAPPSG